MSRIRALVVEDSLTVRRHLCEVLASDPEIEVVGEADDGQRAIELCQTLRPDVVSMDMVLPVMSGLAATEYIMAYCPTPILIVSSSANRGELFHTYDALAAGAVDVLEKPRGDEPDGEWERMYRATIKLVARISVIMHPRARLASAIASSRRSRELPAARPAGEAGYRIVAIGASTGGPGAVVKLLHSLPAPFPLPILLVLHIGKPFGTAFAEWLDAQTEHRVVLAPDGEPVTSFAGRIVLAPPDRHLVVRAGRLRLTDDPERASCRPSIDVLFESLATEYGASCIACLLTGMGRDGAAGLFGIRQAGGLTMAQDEASSVVYGMPREAIRLDAAVHVLSPREMGAMLASAVRLQSAR